MRLKARVASRRERESPRTFVVSQSFSPTEDRTTDYRVVHAVVN